ncbi:MAG: hypothetical protein DMD91_10895 [Candidatus Rokuibacteriota bacterium]|nr:MAG: hypothetical protein DMD91_10895 [Candidatus Rokubacteria bacterium]
MTLALALVLLLAVAAPPAGAADYTGPLIDAHSHVPNATAINAYAAAATRHNVSKVLLLGVGGVQKDDAAWIAAAQAKYPDLVIAGAPVANPAATERVESNIDQLKARAMGEVHVRQISRKIDHDPSDAEFQKLLEVAARRRLPVVIHDELDTRATERLARALSAQPTATVILAHAGESAPPRIEALLDRHPNLVVDLSGMHFQRKPSLASEHGPLDADWKALIEKKPDRFVFGIDVWAARLFEPTMLDRLMKWARRVLGELKPDVAEMVAYRNAATLFGVK